MEGFHIRYRAIPELDEHQGRSAGGSHMDFVVETVSSLTTTMYTLHNLEKNTWYEINVQPFYLTIVGQESNTVRVRTLEDGRQTLCSYSIIIQQLRPFFCQSIKMKINYYKFCVTHLLTYLLTNKDIIIS